jgi:hypothetical protein
VGGGVVGVDGAVEVSGVEVGEESGFWGVWGVVDVVVGLLCEVVGGVEAADGAGNVFEGEEGVCGEGVWEGVGEVVEGRGGVGVGEGVGHATGNDFGQITTNRSGQPCSTTGSGYEATNVFFGSCPEGRLHTGDERGVRVLAAQSPKKVSHAPSSRTSR